MPTTNSVNVVTQACQSDLDNTQARDALGLPRFFGEPGDVALLNDMAQQLEAVVNGASSDTKSCDICPTNGAVVLNCLECDDFQIMATTDINSITMLNCNGGEGTVSILVPPNTTRCICGWPETFGLEGGECFTLCASGGTGRGRTYTFPYRGTNRGPQAKGPNSGGVDTTSGGGGGGSGGGCACVQSPVGNLSLVCCTAGCSMDCNNTVVARRAIELRACGGIPPYTWASTGSDLNLAVSFTSAGVTVTPIVNPSPGTAGTAYVLLCHQNVAGLHRQRATSHGCDGLEISCAAVDPCICVINDCALVTTTIDCSGASTCDVHIPDCSDITVDCGADEGFNCDKRTQAMIDAGCKPCGVVTGGKVITVTDSVGTSASKTLTV